MSSNKPAGLPYPRTLQQHHRPEQTAGIDRKSRYDQNTRQYNEWFAPGATRSTTCYNTKNIFQKQGSRVKFHH